MNTVKLEPLILSDGTRLYHYAVHNLFNATVLTRALEAPPAWFTQVQREIYKYYCHLAATILPTLNSHSNILKCAKQETYEDVMAYIESQLDQNVSNLEFLLFYSKLQK